MRKFCQNWSSPSQEDSTSVPSDNDTASSIISPEEEMDVEEELEDNSFSDDDDEVEAERENLPVVSSMDGSREIFLFNFRPEGSILDLSEHKDIAGKYRLTFKQGKSNCRLVKDLLGRHGFCEVDKDSSEYNLCWMGSHVKPQFLSTMQSFQRVNHFPKSFEITRKDRLYKNVQKMQVLKGFKNFDFVPQTFVLPQEYQEFATRCYREKNTWIVKPTMLSRGRGIFLTTNPDPCMGEEKTVVCKYINNPFLIGGYKFDVRLYVVVTSFDPLVIYLYEEGLTRFATVPFNSSSKTIDNTCMHLTNYSINKKSSAFVSNKNSEVEDHGSKWTLGALLRYLRRAGHKVTDLMRSIEDVIIKTMLSGETSISSACKSYANFKANCFELFGFDILLDENLKPWVLEVNLSPSLACDSPLDLKVKSHMMSDLLNLIGVECQDPQARKNIMNLAMEKMKNSKKMWWKKKLNIHQKITRRSRQDKSFLDPRQQQQQHRATSAEDHRMIQRFREEQERKGNFVRIFPTETTWETYSDLFITIRRSNSVLNSYVEEEGRNRRNAGSVNSNSSDSTDSLSSELVYERCMQYERCLPTLSPSSSTTSLKGVRLASASEAPEGRKRAATRDLVPSLTMKNTKSRSCVGPSALKGETERGRSLAIGKGITLSYLQARKVFSVYLKQIMNSMSNQKSDDMDAVVHFLRKASSRLCRGFSFSEPQGWLTTREKRSHVESQLKSFLVSFDEDTAEQERRQTGRSRGGSSKQLEDTILESFLKKASQSELEAAFNMYTEQELTRVSSLERKLGISLRVQSPNRRSKSNNPSTFAEVLLRHRSMQNTRDRSGWPHHASSLSSFASALKAYRAPTACSGLVEELMKRVNQNLSKEFGLIRTRVKSSLGGEGVGHPLNVEYKPFDRLDGRRVDVVPPRNVSSALRKKDSKEACNLKKTQSSCEIKPAEPRPKSQRRNQNPKSPEDVTSEPAAVFPTSRTCFQNLGDSISVRGSKVGATADDGPWKNRAHVSGLRGDEILRAFGDLKVGDRERPPDRGWMPPNAKSFRKPSK